MANTNRSVKSNPVYYLGLSSQSSKNSLVCLGKNQQNLRNDTAFGILTPPLSKTSSAALKHFLLTKRSRRQDRQLPETHSHSLKSSVQNSLLNVNPNATAKNWLNQGSPYFDSTKYKLIETPCEHTIQEQFKQIIDQVENKGLRVSCIQMLYCLQRPTPDQSQLSRCLCSLLQKFVKALNSLQESVRQTNTLNQNVQPQPRVGETAREIQTSYANQKQQLAQDRINTASNSVGPPRKRQILKCVSNDCQKTDLNKPNQGQQQRAETLKLIRENLKLHRLLTDKVADQSSNNRISGKALINVSSKANRGKTTRLDEQTSEAESNNQSQIQFLKSKLQSQEQTKSRFLRREEIYKDEISNLKTQIQKLKQEICKKQEKIRQITETALMQLEETQVYKLKLKAASEALSLRAKASKHRNILKKSLSSNGDNRLDQIEQQQVPHPLTHAKGNKKLQQAEDREFLKGLGVLTRDKQKQLLSPLLRREDEFGLELGSIQYETRQSGKDCRSQLWKLCYLKPTFYQMIQDSQKQSDAWNQEMYQGPATLDRSLTQKIRMILHCKRNQMQTMEPERYSRFPEFVYRWFKKYDIDSESVLINRSPNQRDQAPQFYARLMGNRTQATWEIITFRQFLLQELCLEDLCFYLHYKNVLFRVAGVSKERQLSTQAYITVQLKAVQSVLELVLHQFDTWNIEILLSRVRQRSFTKAGIQLVDSAFVLRCLLEYYKIERGNRYLFLDGLFHKQSSSGQVDSFRQFEAVLSKLSSFGLDLRLKLYRDCYSVGRGKINAHTLYAVCTEENIFVRFLRLKSFYKPPVQFCPPNKMAFEHTKIACLRPSYPYLYKIFRHLKPLFTEGSKFWKQINQLGVYEHKVRLQKLGKYFGQAHNAPDGGMMRGRHFIHIVQEAIDLITIANFTHMYDLLQDVDAHRKSDCIIQFDENAIGVVYLQNLESAVHIYSTSKQMIEWKRRVMIFRNNCAARKIQRFVRAKLIEPVSKIYKKMYNKVYAALAAKKSST